MTFDLLVCRFQLSARRVIQFPAGMPGNVLRGALGHALRETASAEDYARIFEPPACAAGPSGLSDPPRPFVIRASNLDGRMVQAGERFCFGVNLFDTHHPPLDPIRRAFAKWAELVSVEDSRASVNLNPRSDRVCGAQVEFQTPTELKNTASPEFGVLLARIRDRVSTLRALYGAGPLEIDFRGIAERARTVRTVRSELTQVRIERRSSRTGQRHGIGGFTGFAEYEGDLAEFVPYLEAAQYTGVGRHCTWGNGQIRVEILNSSF
ncbi:MAG TPA: CRISPR system precrRNA processing endoribonuclease RAMP protein Cas6 [Bryobacteraceae bacterium]|nr:CRISPR system precrRNA processing endoribonuclease RAMP protein Cas6 [Bryobacteraceae bacterium]